MKKGEPKPDYKADKKLIQEGKKEIKKPKKKWTTKKVREFLLKEELEKKGITFEQYEEERIKKSREKIKKAQEKDEKEYQEWKRLGFKGNREYFSQLELKPEVKKLMYERLVKKAKERRIISPEERKELIDKMKKKLLKKLEDNKEKKD